MSGNNTHSRMQYAWRHAIQSNECRKQIPFKRLEINPLSLMNQLINHPFLCYATSQECSVEWLKINLRGVKNCNEWPDCYLYYTASRVSLSQVPWWVVGITLPKAENLSFLPSIAPKAPPRPPGIISVNQSDPSDRNLLFFWEDFWQTGLCEHGIFHLSAAAVRRCVFALPFVNDEPVKYILSQGWSDKSGNLAEQRRSFWLEVFLPEHSKVIKCFESPFTRCVCVSLQGRSHQKTQLWMRMTFTEAWKSWPSKYYCIT